MNITTQQPRYVAKNWWYNHTAETQIKWGKAAIEKLTLHYSRIKAGQLKARARKHLRRILVLEAAFDWLPDLGITTNKATVALRLQYEYQMYEVALKYFEEKSKADAEKAAANKQNS